jgi:hypothetical protein
LLAESVRIVGKSASIVGTSGQGFAGKSLQSEVHIFNGNSLYGILRLEQFAYGRQSRPAPVSRPGFAGKSWQSKLHIFNGNSL